MLTHHQTTQNCQATRGVGMARGHLVVWRYVCYASMASFDTSITT